MIDTTIIHSLQALKCYTIPPSDLLEYAVAVLSTADSTTSRDEADDLVSTAFAALEEWLVEQDVSMPALSNVLVDAICTGKMPVSEATDVAATSAAAEPVALATPIQVAAQMGESPEVPSSSSHGSDAAGSSGSESSADTGSTSGSDVDDVDELKFAAAGAPALLDDYYMPCRGEGVDTTDGQGKWADIGGVSVYGVSPSAWRGSIKGGASGVSREVAISRLCVGWGGNSLLEDATLRLHGGRHYAMVGINGSGKSTLCSCMAAGALPGWPRHLSALLIKEDGFRAEPDATVADIVSAPARAWQAAVQAAMDQATDDLVATEGDDAARTALESKLESLCAEEEEAALQASESTTIQALDTVLYKGDPHRKFSELSGGWRMRVCLASAVAAKPDILILDEPSTHLSMAAVQWLASWVREYSGTVLMVSHEASLLNSVSDEVVHLHHRQLEYYPGDLLAFLQARSHKRDFLMRAQANLDKKRDHMRASAARMEASAALAVGKIKGGSSVKMSRLKGDEKKLKQVAQRRKRAQFVGLETTLDGKKFNAQKHGRRVGSEVDNAGGWKNGKMSAGAMCEASDKEVHFSLPADCAAPAGSSMLLSAAGVVAGYAPGAPVVSGVDCGLAAGARIVVHGRNGAGKSTVLNTLIGQLPALAGEIEWTPGLRVGHFSQHGMTAMPKHCTPVHCVLGAAALRANNPLVAHLQDGSLGRVSVISPELAAQAACTPGVLAPSVEDPTWANLKAVNTRNLEDARRYCGHFGLTGHLALAPLAALSAGQRTRAALAVTFYGDPHVVLADEPSNSLDFSSRVALASAFSIWPGALILVSHDIVFTLTAKAHMAYSVQDGTWAAHEDVVAWLADQYGTDTVTQCSALADAIADAVR